MNVLEENYVDIDCDNDATSIVQNRQSDLSEFTLLHEEICNSEIRAVKKSYPYPHVSSQMHVLRDRK